MQVYQMKQEDSLLVERQFLVLVSLFLCGLLLFILCGGSVSLLLSNDVLLF